MYNLYGIYIFINFHDVLYILLMISFSDKGINVSDKIYFCVHKTQRIALATIFLVNIRVSLLNRDRD